MCQVWGHALTKLNNQSMTRHFITSRHFTTRSSSSSPNPLKGEGKRGRKKKDNKSCCMSPPSPSQVLAETYLSLSQNCLSLIQMTIGVLLSLVQHLPYQDCVTVAGINCLSRTNPLRVYGPFSRMCVFLPISNFLKTTYGPMAH